MTVDRPSRCTPGDDLVARGWTVDDGMTLAGGTPLSTIVATHGTPTYAYYLPIIDNRVQALGEAFPGWHVSYAVKANPHARLLQRLCEQGCDLEVSSRGELQAARSVVGSSRVGVVGPGKDDQFIADAMRAGVSWIAAESETELRRTLVAKRQARTESDILLRVNVASPVKGARETMAGLPSQFGVDEEQVAAVLRSVGPEATAGLHLYAGSQVVDVSAAGESFETLLEAFTALSREATGWTRIVCGLGLGVNPQVCAQRRVTPADIRSQLSPSGASSLARTEATTRQRELDIGRYLVADAGVLLTSVIDVKTSRGRQFAIVDSGMRSFARPMTPWGEAHGISVLGQAQALEGDVVTVVGPACLPGDVLAQDIVLPRLSAGDVLIVHSAGAYGLTMSPVLWSSFGETTEVVVDE